MAIGWKEEMKVKWLNKLLFLCKRIDQTAIAKMVLYIVAINTLKMIAEAEF